MGFLKRLRNRDDKRTRAAELTLRQSIYPLMLVTILFFLWVCLISTQYAYLYSYLTTGLLVRPHRHTQQALSGSARYHAVPLVRSTSCILWSISFGKPGSCELDPPTLGIQSMLHLGPYALWDWCPPCLAMSCIPLFRWLLRCNVCGW
jgi:hypothetical protein